MAETAEPQPVTKPVIVGSVAYWLGKRADESKSHEWTIHVRTLDADEDPGLWIKKVVFHLHPTLVPPTRVVETPPFEVTDQGWGEFEVQIEIYFHDASDKPLPLTHLLKLYPDGDQAPSAARPVVSERYDECVFNAPSAALRARFDAAANPSPNGWRTSPHAKWYTPFEPQEQYDQLQQMYQTITAELQHASKRRLALEEELRHQRFAG